ncbi:unnamed protein product [Closterium sp. NIES-64]|nr:unnamed protein product [Closterium sp. NIES-64]
MPTAAPETSSEGLFGSKDAAELVASVREVFRSGRTRSREWRETQLRGIERLMMDEEEAIFAALAKDLKRSRVENVLCEVSTNFVNMPARSEIVPEPFGAVLIFAAWNMPFCERSPPLSIPTTISAPRLRVVSARPFSPRLQPPMLSLDPLIGAIAAGNVAVLKPSELAPASSALLAELLPRYVDKEAVRVVQGGADVATALLECRWDKIFFTGGAAIGRRVLAAAAQHLTPVALELGGKNPAYIDSSADFNICVKRIAFGMCVNAGQSCLSPDYVLVEEAVADQFTDHLRRTLTSFYGSDPKQSPDLARIATPGSWARLHALLSDPVTKEHIVAGGETDEATRYIAPTIIRDVPLDAPVMHEEGFGPVIAVIKEEGAGPYHHRSQGVCAQVLPGAARCVGIVARADVNQPSALLEAFDRCHSHLLSPSGDKVRGVDEAISIIASRPKPLALYLFTTHSTVIDRFVKETSSGAVCVNDTTSHFVNPALPFGGVGDSGMGSYHGKHSFDCFSHRKAVMVKGTLLDFPVRYPPGSPFNENLVKALMNLWFVQLVLVILGLKSSQ